MDTSMDTSDETDEDMSSLNSSNDERRRVVTLRVFNLSVIFTMIGTSIGVSSVWPYIQTMDSSVTPQFIGWVNTGMGVGTLVADLLFGRWMSARNCKEPLLFSIVCMIIAGLLYLYAQSMETSGAVIVLIARSVYGVSRGNLVLCRAGVAEASTARERTASMGKLVLFQALGYSIGAGFQMIFVQVGKGVYIEPLKMHLNLYTIPGFISVVLGIFNFLVVIYFFEHKGRTIEKKNYLKNMVKTDYVAMASLLIIFTISYFGAASLETILTPLVMDEYALTKEEAVFYVGIILLLWGLICACQMQFFHRLLIKRFSDATLLIVSLSIMATSYFLFIPFGNKYPKLLTKGDTIVGNTTLSSASSVGCPATYDWCTTTPQLALEQFIVTSMLFPLGYCCTIALLTALYSKIRGPRAQGSYMSILSSFGDTARLVAPSVVARSYVSAGPRWTSIWLDILLLLALLILFINYKRFLPYHEQSKNENIEHEKWFSDLQANEENSNEKSLDTLYVTAL